MEIESKAFQQAALRSEELRIKGLLALLSVLLIYAFARTISIASPRLLAALLVLIVITIGYELFMLRFLKRALAEGRDIASWVWMLNLLIETQVPTIALIILTRNQVFPPFQVLVTPAMLVYFLYIILSTLRLSPLLSILSGVLSGLGYLAVVVHAILEFENDSFALPFVIYFAFAGLIVLSGLVAAFVAQQIRGHVSAALHEAELQAELERVNHDLDVAKSIQQGLLPSDPPGLEEFEIAGWNQPADQTGGDYFDWQKLPDGRVAVSLADATGHGIGPALISSSCRAYARATLLADRHGDAVLDRLNVLLAEDLPSNRFLTFALIFLEPANSKVQVMSAGHGPILWYKRGQDKMDSLDAQGIPLGMIPGIEYGNATEGVLEPGDMLALVTDGFFEWEDPAGEQFGIPRMEAVLREACDLDADQIIARLRTAVEVFCQGTKQMDDLTAVILKRKARV